MITLTNVTRSFGSGEGEVSAVKDVSLTIEAGSFVTIVGASGSGKTTLLHLIGALDRPTHGQVLFEGHDLGTISDDARTVLRRRRMGFVFQFFNLLPTLTAIENVALPARLTGTRKRAARDRAESLLEAVGLTARGMHRPDQLSGGEMQRVAVARSLMMDPPLILADEPTGNLDTRTGSDILELLRGAVGEARTVVLITHDPAIARQGSRILTLSDGRLVREER